MDAVLKRNYELIRRKYNELLLPTFFMVMSEKLCVIVDVLIIGAILGSTQMTVVNMASPLTYVSGIFYILFGQGGSILALRAQSKLQYEKTNFYFTISVLGIIVVSAIYVLCIFLFMDNILAILNVPPEIFALSKKYLSIFAFYFPLNCFLLVVSFFVRSDGRPKRPFYAVLMANLFNIFFDVLFLAGFGWGIESTALASVLGYLIGTIYISKYVFEKDTSFKMISLAKFKFKEILISIKEIVLNTPEVIGKIFFSSKTILLTYLCSTHYGVAGLLAFLVYDNSESVVYMFLSGIMKTMSPIVTVLHKEKDYEAVRYTIIRSAKQILLISVPVSIVLFLYPEILLPIFNVTKVTHAKVFVLAIRITSFSLVGRCMSYLLANYAQATEHNRVSLSLTVLEEGVFAIAGALILTHALAGIGIWISILVAECLPVIGYILYTIYYKRSHNDDINALFMLQNSKLVTWTCTRDNLDNLNQVYLEKTSTTENLFYIRDFFKDGSVLVLNSANDICEHIFENNKDLTEIDLTIRAIKDELYVIFTSDGKLYNPFSNESLMKSDNIVKLSKLKCKFEYDEVLGFNREYIIFKK